MGRIYSDLACCPTNLEEKDACRNCLTRSIQWKLSYQLTTSTKAPDLPVPHSVLAKLLAIRTKLRDFVWYDAEFRHEDARPACSCRRPKTPEHTLYG